MPKIEARLSCPVCLGLPMQKVRLPGTTDFILDYCQRCGGVFFEQGEVQRLQLQRPQVLLTKITFHPESHVMQCHSCHAGMDRDAAKCPRCGWDNVLDCPGCHQPMKKLVLKDLHLDVCKTCKGVWFDNRELTEIWNGKLDEFMTSKTGLQVGSQTGDAALLMMDVLTYNPVLLYYGAQAAAATGKVALEVSTNMMRHAPQAAGAVFEGAGELAGSVFKAIAEIINDIFS